jgi:hypothetical protein
LAELGLKRSTLFADKPERENPLARRASSIEWFEIGCVEILWLK